jgi:hypothetical protein
MRMTLDLPMPLIDEAMRLSPERTKTAMIVAALEDFVRKQRLLGLKRFKAGWTWISTCRSCATAGESASAVVPLRRLSPPDSQKPTGVPMARGPR